MAVLANMKRATESMIRGFNTTDAEALISCRAPDCLQHLLPKSLDRPPQTNTEYEQFMLNAWKTFSDWKFVPEHIVYDADARKCAFYATGSAQSPIGPYTNEYAWFLSFDEDGGKIVKILEFVDSAYTKEFFAKVQANQTAGSTDSS